MAESNQNPYIQLGFTVPPGLGKGVRNDEALKGIAASDRDLLASGDIIKAMSYNNHKLGQQLAGICPLKIQSMKVKALCLDHRAYGNNGINATAVADTCSIGLDIMYNEGTTGSRADTLRAASAYLTILSAFVDFRTLASSSLKSTMESANMLCNVVYLDNRQVQEYGAIAWDNLSVFKADFPTKLDARDAITCMGLACLLLMGKHLNDTNHLPWFTRRLGAISSILAFPSFGERLKPPPVAMCQRVHTLFSANLAVRRSIFLIIRSLGMSPDTFYARVFNMMIRQFEWVDMTHIQLILFHIYQHNIEILAFYELRSEAGHTMANAVRFLNTIPEQDRPFARILYSTADCDPILARHFPYHVKAASVIGSMTQASLHNFTNHFSPEVEVFGNNVRFYITARNSQGAYSAAEVRSHMTGTLSGPRLLNMFGQISDKSMVFDYTQRQAAGSSQAPKPEDVTLQGIRP